MRIEGNAPKLNKLAGRPPAANLMVNPH